MLVRFGHANPVMPYARRRWPTVHEPRQRKGLPLLAAFDLKAVAALGSLALCTVLLGRLRIGALGLSSGRTTVCT